MLLKPYFRALVWVLSQLNHVSPTNRCMLSFEPPPTGANAGALIAIFRAPTLVVVIRLLTQTNAFIYRLTYNHGLIRESAHCFKLRGSRRLRVSDSLLMASC